MPLTPKQLAKSLQLPLSIIERDIGLGILRLRDGHLSQAEADRYDPLLTISEAADWSEAAGDPINPHTLRQQAYVDKRIPIVRVPRTSKTGREAFSGYIRLSAMREHLASREGRGEPTNLQEKVLASLDKGFSIDETAQRCGCSTIYVQSLASRDRHPHVFQRSRKTPRDGGELKEDAVRREIGVGGSIKEIAERAGASESYVRHMKRKIKSESQGS